MDLMEIKQGSAKDNMSSPVHNWNKYTVGFSYKSVNAFNRAKTIHEKKLKGLNLQNQ